MSATALHLAAFDGDTETVNRLLSGGADANARTTENETPPLFAAMNGHTDAVRVLLKWGAEVNVLPDEGHTAVRRAIRGGHAEIVRMLLARGADVDIEPREKPVPPEEIAKMRETMREAAEKTRKALEAFDIAPGKSLFDGDDFFNTPQEPLNPLGYGKHRAVKEAMGSGSVETVTVLLDAGFPVEAPAAGLIKTAPIELAQNVPNGLEIARLLLQQGANPDGGGPVAGMTPLQAAVMRGNLPMAQLLLEAGASTDKGKVGMGLLTLALMRENKELVALLAERGIGLDDKTLPLMARHSNRPQLMEIIEAKRGTAWLKQVEAGDLDAVRVALVGGADANATNPDGKPALTLAIKTGNVEIVRVLLDAGANVPHANEYGATPLHDAAINGNAEVVALLGERGADVRAENRWGQTPLFSAASGKHHAAADALIAAGATLGVVEAILLGREEAVNGFWERGTPVTFANESGTTPLHAAVMAGNLPLAAWLLERGADIEAKTRFDSTPLDVAVTRDNADAVRLLLDSGANPDGGNKERSRPLSSAVTHRNASIVRLLLKRGATLEQSLPSGVTERMASGDPEHQAMRDGMLADMRSKRQLLPQLLSTYQHVQTGEMRDVPTAWRDTDRLWETARVLIEFGADVNGLGDANTTPFADLFEFGAPMDLIRLALEHGASVNPVSESAHAPLMLAVQAGRTELVELLLARGANVHGGLTTESPLQIARENGNAEIVSLLEAHGASDETRQKALADGFGEMAQWMVRSVSKTPAPATLATMHIPDFGELRQKMSDKRLSQIAERRERLVREVAEGNG